MHRSNPIGLNSYGFTGNVAAHFNSGHFVMLRSFSSDQDGACTSLFAEINTDAPALSIIPAISPIGSDPSAADKSDPTAHIAPTCDILLPVAEFLGVVEGVPLPSQTIVERIGILPLESTLDIGLFKQYANILYPSNAEPVLTYPSTLTNLQVSGS